MALFDWKSVFDELAYCPEVLETRNFSQSALLIERFRLPLN